MNARMVDLTPADVPLLWELAREQNAMDGTSYAPPRIFDDQDRRLPNIPLALKLVVDGRLLQGHIFERQVELLTFGTSPRATALSFPHLAAAVYILKGMGYTGMHTEVPLSRLPFWAPGGTLGQRLKMTRDDERLAHFYRPFDPGREGETR